MSYSAEVLVDTPLIYYRLDETSGTTVTDSSGNSHAGTYNGTPTLAQTGLLWSSTNKAVAFNGGSGKFVNTAGASYMNLTTYSVEAWFQTTTAGAQMVLCSRDDASTKIWSLGLDSSSRAYFGTYSGGTGQAINSGSRTYIDGVAHHIVGMRSGTTMQLYVDGILVATGSFASFDASTTLAINLGRRNDDTLRYTGTLDEFAFYGSALSATRVAAHYSAGRGAYSVEVLADTPLAYLRMDETTGTALADDSGNGHTFTLAGSTLNQATVMPSGLASILYGNATTNNASCVYASWMDQLSFSAEAWVKAVSVTGDHAIVSRDYSGPRGWQFYIENGFLAVYDSSNVNPPWTGVVPLSTATAYHVAMTYDNSSQTLKLYVNGTLDSTFTSVPITNSSSVFDMFIAVSHAGNTSTLFFPFNGNIDEFAYYGSVLSPARVAAHFLAANGNNTGAYARTVLADGPFAYWQLAETTGTTAADSSGNGWAGSYLGGFTLNAVTTTIGAAVTFNGSSGYMEVPGASPTRWSTSDYTLECWAFFPNISTTAGEAHPVMVPAYSGTGAIGGALGYSLDAASTQLIQGGHYNGVWRVTTDTGVRSINTWYHLVITWVANTTLHLYVNGTQVATATPGTGVGVPTNFPAFRICHRWDTAGIENFTGATMQHAAVYTKALSAGQVSGHYLASLGTQPSPTEHATNSRPALTRAATR